MAGLRGSPAWTLALCAGAGLTAQQWQFGLDITGRSWPALAYDLARGRTLLFGGSTVGGPTNETWAFDGTDWHQLQPPNRPRARILPALAYDVLRDRVVLFGGLLDSNARTNDTWEFDGNTWTQVLTAHAPSPRWTAMTYDLARGQVVLFGGDDDSGMRDDTWVFDGTDWTQLAPATVPLARRAHALAYDSARGRTVMFAGEAGTADTTTWEFDGTDWIQVATPTTPRWRRYHGMTYDLARQRVVMSGGWGPFSIRPNLAETWEYDGTDWTLRTPAESPTPQWNTALAYDVGRQETVLFGNGNGANSDGNICDTWTWDGSAWTFHGQPAARIQAAFAHDTLRGRTVMHGGSNSGYLGDTWEHDGTRWHRIATPGISPIVEGHALAFDPQRGRTVLFGGAVLFLTSDQTWEYDGAAWTQRLPATSPPARAYHAMAYDAGRRHVVLFGGETGTSTRTYFNDTWEYDGTTWQQVTPASLVPAARSRMPMVYEAAKGRMLLFGGTNNASFAGFSDTWVYDGATWQQLAPVHVPPARHGHGLAYDTLRGRTLLFGGTINSTTALGDTWEFDGTDWAPVTTPTSPSARACSLVFQQDTGSVLAFGGMNANRNPLAGTHTFVPAATPTFTRHGVGCPGSAGVPRLDTQPPALPALGTTFPLQLSGLPATPGVALLAFGFDLVRWNGAVLPLDLGAYGLPGCDLWIGPTQGMSELVPYAGTASYALNLPAAAILAGLVVEVQALVFDAAAAGGLGAVSNAAILRLH